MIEGIPVSLLDGIGVVAVVLLLLALFMRGTFYTGAEVRRMEAAHLRELEAAEHRENEWRAEGRIKDQQLAVKDDQLAEKDRQLEHMAEVGRTVRAIMGAIQKGAVVEVEQP